MIMVTEAEHKRLLSAAAGTGRALTRDQFVAALEKAGLIFQESDGSYEIAVREGFAVDRHIDSVLATLNGELSGSAS